MTIVTTATSSGPYAAVAQTTFAVTFQSAGDGEVEVKLDGVIVDPALYIFNRDDDGTGEVIFLDPVTGSVEIITKPLFTQLTAYSRFGAFYPDQIDPPLDRSAAKDLYLKRLIDGIPQIDIAASAATAAAAAAAAIAAANALATHLFTELSGVTISNAVNVIRTKGHTVAGVGGALYVYDAAIDPAAVAANPTWKVRTANGRGFRLAETVVSPFMFGAKGDAFPTWAAAGTFNFTFAGENAATVDTVAVQASSDFLYTYPRVTLDLSGGTWGIDATIYFAFPTAGWTYAHKIIGGHFYIMPGFVEGPEKGAIVQGGYEQNWEGELYIDGGIRTYNNRRITNGLVVVQSNSTDMCKVRVEGTKRDAIYFERSDVPITVRTGTPYANTYGYSNNIGYKGSTVYARGIGMCATVDLGLPYKAFTAIHGGVNPVGAEDDWVWDPTPASFVGSAFQRSRLTLPANSTGDYRKGDIGKVRTETAVATYVSYAADATAGTLTWTAGDPVAAGFAVGDQIVNDFGPNGTIRYTIKGFSGTSNRVISVWPKPAETHTAYTAGHAYAVFYKPYSYHLVTRIVSSTVIEVWPWLPPDQQAAGEWRSCHGSIVDIGHSNTAAVSFDHVGSFGVGTGGRLTGLYGARLGVFLPEYCDVGLVHGLSPIAVALGSEIGLCHFEACLQDFIQVTTSQSAKLQIGPSSFFSVNQTDPFERSLPMGSRTNLADKEITHRPFYGVTFDGGGEVFTQGTGSSYMNTAADNAYTAIQEKEISNRPRSRHRTMVSNSGTAELRFHHDMSRCFGDNHWSELLWVSPTGVAPTGNLTFTLTTPMTWAGWTIVGTASFTAPTKPLMFRFVFDWVGKKVIIAASSYGI